MLMKKFFLMMAMTLIGSTAALANYDYPYLLLQANDGTTQSVSVTSLRLTFSDTQLTATNDEGTYHFTLASLSKMFFSERTSSVSTAVDAVSTKNTVEVYTLSGLFVGRYASVSAARNTLVKGIYVFKSNDKTYKTTIR